MATAGATAAAAPSGKAALRPLPVEADDHLRTVLRCVERNPLRAGLVARAGEWL